MVGVCKQVVNIQIVEPNDLYRHMVDRCITIVLFDRSDMQCQITIREFCTPRFCGEEANNTEMATVAMVSHDFLK